MGEHNNQPKEGRAGRRAPKRKDGNGSEGGGGGDCGGEGDGGCVCCGEVRRGNSSNDDNDDDDDDNDDNNDDDDDDDDDDGVVRISRRYDAPPASKSPSLSQQRPRPSHVSLDAILAELQAYRDENDGSLDVPTSHPRLVRIADALVSSGVVGSGGGGGGVGA